MSNFGKIVYHLFSYSTRCNNLIDGRYEYTILHGHNVVQYRITDITDKDYADYDDFL